MSRAYLDYAATAPVHDEVIEAMAAALRDVGNPSSVHGPGRRARARLEAARRALAAALDASPDSLVFTSGGTEANQLALAQARGGPVLVSAIEHPSLLDAAPEALRAPVTADGVLDLEAFERLLAQHRPALVSVMLANNETGVLQPVREAAGLARRHGALVHCDAVQALGKMPVSLAGLDADLLSVSAHKIGGPAGVGALVLRDGLEIAARQRGGGQERKRRAGTENLAGIVGFGRAAELLGRQDWQRVRRLRDRLEGGVLGHCPEIRIHGAAAPRLASTSCLATPGLAADTQLMALDLAGVAVSAGSACSSGRIGPSPVLLAMGVEAALAACSIRVSLGWGNGEEDVDRFLGAWLALWRRKGGRDPAARPGPLSKPAPMAS
ncbi:cysteine desulfurase family protein [Geminicoccaceae bacterium 1502E]|nr:cysteine desulfurase family protein [Geminicoccaceae bacterium 1502E]